MRPGPTALGAFPLPSPQNRLSPFTSSLRSMVVRATATLWAAIQRHVSVLPSLSYQVMLSAKYCTKEITAIMWRLTRQGSSDMIEIDCRWKDNSSDLLTEYISD